VKGREPILERVYELDEVACVGALTLLLKETVSKRAARPAQKPDDPNDAKEPKHGVATGSIPRGK
jgi:hypothetical protein